MFYEFFTQIKIAHSVHHDFVFEWEKRKKKRADTESDAREAHLHL